MIELRAKTLAELRDKLGEHISDLDTKPYGYNIVSLILGTIATAYGDKEASRAVVDYELDALGW